WRSLSGSIRVRPRPVAGDDLDPVVLTQPLDQGGGGAIFEEVDDATPFEVDQYCAVGLALAPRPVVDAEHPRRGGRRERRRVDGAEDRAPTPFQSLVLG